MKRGAVDSRPEYPAWGSWPIPGHSGFCVSTGLCGAQAGCLLQASPAPPPMGWTGRSAHTPVRKLQSGDSRPTGVLNGGTQHCALVTLLLSVSWGGLVGVRRDPEVRSYNCPCYPSILGRTTFPSPSFTASTHPTPSPAHKDVHILILRAVHVNLHGKRNFGNMIKLQILQWESV